MKDFSSCSYVPYSLQPEYCYAVDSDGGIHPGVRIENISYPLSISRVQAALFSCLAAGQTPVELAFPDQPDEKQELLSYWQAEYDIHITTGAPLRTDEQAVRIHDPVLKLSPDETGRSSLYGRLLELCKKAVTPNSDFQVAALLEVGEPGRYIPGVNVECSNWQLGLCAERMAISRAISMGYARSSFGDLYVVAPKSDYVSPCGACRQVISEHMRSSRIFLYENEVKCLSVTTNELLPYHFGGDVLRKQPH
jgi:homotetrameric cytidine deaminase